MTLLPDIAALLVRLVLLTLVAFGAGVLVMRRRLWNVFDPVLLLLLYMALNVAAVAATGWDHHRDDVVFVVAGYALFLAALAAPWDRMRGRGASERLLQGPTVNATRYLLVVSCAALLTYDAFIFASVGFGVFSGVNPDLVKVDVTSAGKGIFRHFMVAATLVHLPLLVHAHFIHRLRVTTALALGVYLLHTFVFSFSKAGLIFIAFDIGLFAYYYERALGRRVLSPRFALGAAAIGAIPAFVVLGLVSARYGVSVVETVMTRLAATGSGSYMYFVLDGADAFVGAGTAERVTLFFDNLLSSLRLKPWAPMSYSARVAEQITGIALPGFGTNPYPFVAGHFVGGVWGGLVYCLAVGAAVGIARSRRLNFLAFYVVMQLALAGVADPGITQSQIVALILFSPALVLLVLLAEIQAARLLVPVAVARRDARRAGGAP